MRCSLQYKGKGQLTVQSQGVAYNTELRSSLQYRVKGQLTVQGKGAAYSIQKDEIRIKVQHRGSEDCKCSIMIESILLERIRVRIIGKKNRGIRVHHDNSGELKNSVRHRGGERCNNSNAVEGLLKSQIAVVNHIKVQKVKVHYN